MSPAEGVVAVGGRARARFVLRTARSRPAVLAAGRDQDGRCTPDSLHAGLARGRFEVADRAGDADPVAGGGRAEGADPVAFEVRAEDVDPVAAGDRAANADPVRAADRAGGVDPAVAVDHAAYAGRVASAALVEAAARGASAVHARSDCRMVRNLMTGRAAD